MAGDGGEIHMGRDVLQPDVPVGVGMGAVVGVAQQGPGPTLGAVVLGRRVAVVDQQDEPRRQDFAQGGEPGPEAQVELGAEPGAVARPTPWSRRTAGARPGDSGSAV